MQDYRMETFLDLCQTRSYTKTAERLFITQPAVTGHIRFLERYYEAPLFVYNGKKVHLTEEGKQLERYALTLRADQTQMKRLLSGTEKKESPLRFGATKSIGSFCMGQAVTDYLQSYPQTALQLHVDNTRQLLQLLEQGEIEFALIEGFFESSHYLSHRVAQVNFIGACAANHPLADKSVTFQELLPHRLILREEGSGTRDIAEGILREQNLCFHDFNKTVETGSFPLIKDLLKRGLGITFVYECVVAEELRQGTIRTLQLEGFTAKRAFYIVSLKNRVFDSAIHNFYDFLQQKDYFQTECPFTDSQLLQKLEC